MEPDELLRGAPPATLESPICRALDRAVELRDAASEGENNPGTMVGDFSVFNDWYEINSMWEGRFLERLAPGAFKRTINNRSGQSPVRVLLEHGYDPSVGDKPLGVPSVLDERDSGVYAETPLLDTSYCRDLAPALAAGAYGQSFRFRVMVDEWVDEPERSEHNLDGIPERTIKEVRLIEFGPTVFPASPATNESTGLRSTTDEFYERLRRRDTTAYDAALARTQAIRLPNKPAEREPAEPVEDRAAQLAGLDAEDRAAQLAELGADTPAPAEDPNTPEGRQQTLAELIADAPVVVVDNPESSEPEPTPAVDEEAGRTTSTTEDPQSQHSEDPQTPPAEPEAREHSEDPPGDEHSAEPTPAPSIPTNRSTNNVETMTVEERRNRLSEIRARLTNIDNEYRGAALPDDIKTEWDKLLSENADHKVAIEDNVRRTAELAEINPEDDDTRTESVARPSRRTPGTPAGSTARVAGDIYDLTEIRQLARSVDEMPALYRDHALRAVERAQFSGLPKGVSREDAQAHVERVLAQVDDKNGSLAQRILETGSPLYERAFGKYVVKQSSAGLSVEEQRALAMGAGDTGGFAVPFQLDPTIILTNGGSTNPLRRIARVEQIVGKEWDGITSAGVTVSRVPEATEATDGSPVLAQPTVKAERVQGFIPFSIEAEQDWRQLGSSMTTLLADAKDREEATSFITGDGTPPAAGGLIGTLNVSSNVTANTFAVGSVYALEDALPDRFLDNASFLGHRSVFNLVRQFDTAGGASMWVRLPEGQPSELIGYPSYRTSAMADSTLTTGDRYLVLGDFSNFLIVDRVGMTIDLVPHLFGTANNFPTGQRGVFALWRNNSKVLVDNAFRVLHKAA